MKTSLPKLFSSRIVQAGGLLAIIAAFAASMAWSRPPQAVVNLEGAWVATVDNGVRGLVTYGPSDPNGLRATFRNHMIVPPEVLAAFGVEAITDEIAEEFVTGINTSTYSGIFYGLIGGRIATIALDHSVITRDSPAHGTIEHTLAIYLATADADNDGYPDPGSTPVTTMSARSTTQRVTR